MPPYPYSATTRMATPRDEPTKRQDDRFMETRRSYRDRLLALEDSLLRAGDGYRNQLLRSVEVVMAGAPEGTQQIISSDDALDGLAAYVRDEAIELIALHSPVAGELRVLSAILHVDTMLERLGELAINLSRTAGSSDPDASHSLMRQLDEMGRHVDTQVLRALEGFARRRDDTAEMIRLDDQIDRLRTRLQDQLIACAKEEPDRIEWAIRMSLAATALERAGDLSVAISRQTAFVVSGLTPRRAP